MNNSFAKVLGLGDSIDYARFTYTYRLIAHGDISSWILKNNRDELFWLEQNLDLDEKVLDCCWFHSILLLFSKSYRLRFVNIFVYHQKYIL